MRQLARGCGNDRQRRETGLGDDGQVDCETLGVLILVSERLSDFGRGRVEMLQLSLATKTFVFEKALDAKTQMAIRK